MMRHSANPSHCPGIKNENLLQMRSLDINSIQNAEVQSKGLITNYNSDTAMGMRSQSVGIQSW